MGQHDQDITSGPVMPAELAVSGRISFGFFLQSFAEARGMKSNGEIAKLLGVNRSTVSRLLTGTRQPGRDVVERLVALPGMHHTDVFAAYWLAGFAPPVPVVSELAAVMASNNIPTYTKDLVVHQIALLIRWANAYNQDPYAPQEAVDGVRP
jgi:transcriptional regulator with XRE-family HTH domain